MLLLQRALLLSLACGTLAFKPGLQRRIGRRDALATAVATVTAAPTASPVFAEPIRDAALYIEEPHNEVGDAALYTPSIRVDAKGSTNSKLSVIMPKKGPRTANDFVDCMWMKDGNSGLVIAAESYGANGLSRDKSLQSDSGKEPEFAFRVKSGSTVVPMIHTKGAGTWEGKPFTL
jgi:hypothetical protein